MAQKISVDSYHRWHVRSTLLLTVVGVGVALSSPVVGQEKSHEVSGHSTLDWQTLPNLPDELGVAGAFAGVHGDALIVAGGANFPQPVWDNEKIWRDAIHVLTKVGDDYEWKSGGTLRRPIGYGTAVSTANGVICIGGNDGTATFDEVFALHWNPAAQKVTQVDYPSLPQPCAYGQAVLVGNVVYVAGGQSGGGLESAMTNFWALDLSKMPDANDAALEADAFEWQELAAWPGGSRAFNITASQHNGYEDCVYVMSGRRKDGDSVEFLADVWEFTPGSGRWRRRSDVPRPVLAGTGIGFGQSHIFVLGGDDGSLFFRADELRDQHPGFPKESLAYHTITDTWTSAGAMPQNHVTTVPVLWDGRIIIASGEVRPRVRSPAVWSVTPIGQERGFGTANYCVLFGYLLAMVGVGLYFARRNRNTDDYFRGGKHIPWWAAGCSIFATMLSSLTFTGIPSKAFAQDWVYAVGNFMIPVVAFVGVYVALPFYRRIDATSAYEYLEKRFSRNVRLFGSASFTLYHVFRMAVVMSLTGLALAVATPLTPEQSVLLMGVLSILYCTMGGIEAVIWTDTIQTVVLLGGGLLALVLLVSGTDGGFSGSLVAAQHGDKLRLANFHRDVTNAQLALWVVVIGALGQNVSSYTADQAVVQRYMTTKDQKLAARAIWTNAVMTIPATFLFFGIGTALYAFYRSHPEKLDPTITTDQIFPLFIAHEMPVGVAGLIVAGIFSSSQSTVSTSMNSTATTIVTDFMRPFNACRTEQGYLKAARVITLIMGVVGTLFGLVFVDPEIKSLFDAFIKVIGLFMGVLGGLFVLGVLTRRANAFGALSGAFVGAMVMFLLWRFTNVNGYLYTFSGIVTCVIAGYGASFVRGEQDSDLTGLTIFTTDEAVSDA
ncbi:MAG: sodium/solute symporter [Fuerstiella sp.]|nr:sodium/solute symporter [Fuerstiella sp.]